MENPVSKLKSIWNKNHPFFTFPRLKQILYFLIEILVIILTDLLSYLARSVLPKQKKRSQMIPLIAYQIRIFSMNFINTSKVWINFYSIISVLITT